MTVAGTASCSVPGVVEQAEHGFDDHTGPHLALGEHEHASAAGQDRALDAEQRPHVEHGKHPTAPVGGSGEPDRPTRHAGQDGELEDVVDRAERDGVPTLAQPQQHVRLLHPHLVERFGGPWVVDRHHLRRRGLHGLVIGGREPDLKPRAAAVPP